MASEYTADRLEVKRAAATQEWCQLSQVGIKPQDAVAEPLVQEGVASASSPPMCDKESTATREPGRLPPTESSTKPNILQRVRSSFMRKARLLHKRTPYIRRVPLPAILIIALLISINIVVWAICALILTRHRPLLGTAALAYSLGLRHALDADHISAIDLMTRRLIASGQQPVTVGTFFSLGHSTIVVVTSIVVAATAAGVSERFGGFSNIGGIIGTSISAAFLILLGIMNAYILYKLLVQLRKVIHLPPDREQQEAFNFDDHERGGILFRVLKRMFKLIDRPWKMYPLGILFGLGFDTSSEVALLGISSIQGAKGTSIWLILIFPVLFTVGMCMVDTIDGALMMGLYVAPMGVEVHDDQKREDVENGEAGHRGETSWQADMGGRMGTVVASKDGEQSVVALTCLQQQPRHQDQAQTYDRAEKPNQEQVQSWDQTQTPGQSRDRNKRPQPDITPEAPSSPSSNNTNSNTIRIKSPLTFLYYSSVLTLLTVLVALTIGSIQLLSLILNVAVSSHDDNAAQNSPFWRGVAAAGDHYDIIGGAICAAFVLVGVVSVLCYRPFRRWVERRRKVAVAAEQRMRSSSGRDQD